MFYYVASYIGNRCLISDIPFPAFMPIVANINLHYMGDVPSGVRENKKDKTWAVQYCILPWLT